MSREPHGMSPPKEALRRVWSGRGWGGTEGGGESEVRVGAASASLGVKLAVPRLPPSHEWPPHCAPVAAVARVGLYFPKTGTPGRRNARCSLENATKRTQESGEATHRKNSSGAGIPRTNRWPYVCLLFCWKRYADSADRLELELSPSPSGRPPTAVGRGVGVAVGRCGRGTAPAAAARAATRSSQEAIRAGQPARR